TVLSYHMTNVVLPLLLRRLEVGIIIDRADFSRIPPMPYASFAAACRTPWRVVVPLKEPLPHGDLSRASYFIPIRSQRPRIYAEDQCPRIHADPRLCCGVQDAIHTPLGTEGSEKGGKNWEPSTS